MGKFNHYSDSTIYRRVKFYIFTIALLFASVFLTFTIKNLVTFLIIPKLPEVMKTDVSEFWFGITQNQHHIISGILFLIIFFSLRGSFLGGWLGRIIVGWQNLKDSGRFSSGGNARFTGMLEEYQQTKRSKTSLYFGRSLFNPFWQIHLRDDRHMLTFAGSRSGKGASCIIPNLLEWKGSVLCIDPKGTNVNVTAKARRALGDHVHVIDPFNVVENEVSACFNPLSIIDPTNLTVVEDVRLISEALVPNEADGKNIHFTEGAKTLLDGYIVHVVTSGEYANPSLIDVYNIVNMTAQQAIDIHTKMFANEACGGLAKQAAARVMDGMGTNEFGSVVATLKTNLKWLASEAFKETLSKSDFSFDKMKFSNESAFVVIPPDLLITHKRFLRLFVNVASSRYTRGGKARVPTLFIIDECPALGYMEEIAKAYGELASYNLIMWTFFQDKGQLNDIYGSRAQTFIGSSRAVQMFSIKDEDADWAAKMIGTRGNTHIAAENTTTSITAHRDTGSIEREIGRDSGKQYLFRSGKTPMLLSLMPYFESYLLAPQASRDPDHPWPSKAYTTGRNRARFLGYLLATIVIIVTSLVSIIAGFMVAEFISKLLAYIFQDYIAKGIGILGGIFFFINIWWFAIAEDLLPSMWKDVFGKYLRE